MRVACCACLAALVCASACATSGDARSADSSLSSSRGRARDANAPALVRALSATIGPYSYKDWVQFPVEAAGYGITYAREEGGWLDFYVYPVPAALDDRSAKELCESERDQALSDVQSMVEQGRYQAANVVTQDVLSTDEGHFVCIGELMLLADGTPVRSFAIVSPHDGLFLKVRASDVRRKREQVTADVLQASNAFFAAARKLPLEELRKP